ncbi:MAG: SUMF1/EgtB/PvdO family nonheme iron enzyme [Caldilineaceae bacterium]|nr:SUMF1/EgtB/PvdO family nonheme iron enzyme [Caldilineaceae bacterium]
MSSTRMEWTTGEEIEGRVTGRSSSDPLTTRFKGQDGADRAVSVQRRLTQAVDHWWQRGEMPPIGLVRDALLALEAGHRLEEAELTLLLRGTLYYGKGMRTALHHLHNPERAASVMRDMLLHPVHPLSPAQIVELARRDDESSAWLAALDGLLREEMAQPLEPRRTLAHATLEYLRESTASQEAAPLWIPLAGQENAQRVSGRAAPGKAKGKRRIRVPAAIWRLIANLFGLLSLALFVLALAFFWLDLGQSFDPTGQMVVIPTGIYRISQPGVPDTDRRVALESFSIDRTEVTNQAYRLCFEADGCTWPARTTSISRPDYFLNPALDSFPMVNVTHAQAALFCRWAGKRLPLEEEWEVAASSALQLERAFRYPWGDVFDAARANSATTAVGDTLPVGTYSPGGDSPSGAADMAGNVAEWTATPGNPAQRSSQGYVVKGGSFQDDSAGLATNSRLAVDGEEFFPWLGFRCALTNPTEE